MTGCGTGKRKHGSKKSALAFRRAAKRFAHRTRVYECPECGGWHLTASVGSNPGWGGRWIEEADQRVGECGCHIDSSGNLEPCEEHERPLDTKVQRP